MVGSLKDKINKLNILGLACKLSKIKGKYTLVIKDIGVTVNTIQVPEGIEDIQFENGRKNSIVIKHLKLPSTMTEINKNRFEGSKVEKITIADGCTIIKEHAFKDCYRLDEVVLPKTLEEIQDEAFVSSGISKIELPENCKIIGDGIFSRCFELNEVILPEKMSVISTRMFEFCVARKLNRLMKIDKIGERAFANSGIREITLDKCYSIEPYAFEFSGLEKLVINSLNIEEIKESVFEDCIYLEHVELPKSCKVIRKRAFANCNSLWEIRLPNGLKELEEECFADTPIKKLEVPLSCNKIHPSVISSCKALKVLRIPNHLADPEVLDAVDIGKTELDIYY